jgi:hypothetical protein
MLCLSNEATIPVRESSVVSCLLPTLDIAKSHHFCQYGPSYMLLHFVHYSRVTADMTPSYSDFKQLNPGKEPLMEIHSSCWQLEAPEMLMD